MNKFVKLGLLIVYLGKTVMYEFWYDYVKPKYGEKTKLCYIDTDNFIVYAKADDIYNIRCWSNIWHFKFWKRQTIDWKKK